MYYMNSRVRYSEVDSNRKMTIAALVDNLQDCCTFQSEELGIGVDYLAKNHCAWILSSWEIVVCDFPKFLQNIKVATWPYDFKSFYGYRNFTVEDMDGKMLAYANSVWVYLDTDNLRPIRIPDELAQKYLTEKTPMLEGDWSERKVKVDGACELKEPIVVQKSQIDTNHHVNNGKYIQVALEYLPEDFQVGRIRVEYRKAAVLGDIFYPEVYRNEDVVSVVLADEGKKPYAVIQFLRKK